LDDLNTKIQTDVNAASEELQKYLTAGGSTALGEDYVISPYIGGGYLNISSTQTGDQSKVIINPSNASIFAVYGKTGNKVIGLNADGNAIFDGVVTAS
jgi:hypothetical protein